MGDMNTTFYSRNLNGKGHLKRPRRRWDDKSRMDLGETGWEVVAWMHLVQDSDQWRDFVNTVMNRRFHKRWGMS
jgi:hypothetical protein